LFNSGNLRRPLGSFPSFHLIEASPQRNSIAHRPGAARSWDCGGRDGENDWSSAFDADGKPIANTWQGIFPVFNSDGDGYEGTAPVGCFKANGWPLRHDRKRLGVDERLVPRSSCTRTGSQPHAS
jgi:hypothetical protein